MLTKGDDYPIHQLPEPIATAGTDRNFYDRYFFNGYSRDGSVFFATALGVYPHLNIMDGAFSVVIDGVQHNLHASRFMGMERMDTQVGPLTIEVLEPLQSLRIRVDHPESGLKADLTYHGRAVAIEEPRFTYRQGPRVLLDYTRLTQNGTYEGWIEVAGKRIEIARDTHWGTRDRSWGVRPIGASDPQPSAPPRSPQFYWLWSPLNFESGLTLYHNNSDEFGRPWNEAAVMCGLDGASPRHMAHCSSELDFLSGSRHAKEATLRMVDDEGGETIIELTPKWTFYMKGLGYGNPDWGHGHFKGELAVEYESFATSDITDCVPPNLHIQAFVEARKTAPDGSVELGSGILEQLIIGPHAPSGFQDILDLAP
ncbi:MAG: hypothetical protein P1U50_00385 [Parvibaculaceae bacterium]|nr:hypothetical protein [Parvibaculaceae bacterium]